MSFNVRRLLTQPERTDKDNEDIHQLTKGLSVDELRFKFKDIFCHAVVFFLVPDLYSVCGSLCFDVIVWKHIISFCKDHLKITFQTLICKYSRVKKLIAKKSLFHIYCVTYSFL